MTGMQSIAALDGSGSFAAYRSGPAAAQAGIVVIQEIFGVNAGIRSMADGWGAKGYVTLAPDLFWRVEPGVELDADIEDQRNKAFGIYPRFSVDFGIADIEACIKALRAAGCQKVGVVGYCLGGLLAYLCATRTDSDASVGYYGGGIDGKLNEAHAIARPLLLHNAAQDHFITAESQARVHAELDHHPRVTLHDYAADHAFARAAGSTRIDALAKVADARTETFFASHLRV